MHTIHKRVLTAVVATGILVAGSAGAFTTTYQASGNACQIYAGNAGPTQVSVGIVNNGSSSAAWVVCPMSASYPVGNGPFSEGNVDYNDASTTDSVYCYPFGFSASGSYTYGQGVYSCSSPGGCSTNSSPSYTGTNSFDWYGGSFTLGITNFQSVDVIAFVCRLPANSAIYGSQLLGP